MTNGTRQHRVTSFEVAAHAGVSQSTVSRALSGHPSISEPTRVRVMEAARELDYQPDETAARLRTGRTSTIAVVIIGREGEESRDVNPFYSSLLGAICAAASARGYETLVSFQNAADTLFGGYQEQRKADGLIVVGTNTNRAAWEFFGRIRERGGHVVFWGSPFDSGDWVGSDNRHGARLAVEHLIGAGYRRPVCITTHSSPQRQFRERAEAYCEIMREAGLEPRLVEVEETQAREEQGRRAVAGLVERNEPFDAAFVVCDQMAHGVMLELHDRGIAIPGRVGVIGFDGIRSGAYTIPPLTSLRPDFGTAGDMLVGKLLRLIDGEAGVEARVPVHLVVRESSRGPSCAGSAQ